MKLPNVSGLTVTHDFWIETQQPKSEQHPSPNNQKQGPKQQVSLHCLDHSSLANSGRVPNARFLQVQIFRPGEDSSSQLVPSLSQELQQWYTSPIPGLTGKNLRFPCSCLPRTIAPL